MRISIYLDMDSSNWLHRNLIDMACGNAHVGWVRKIRGPKSTLVLEQQQNRYGRFGRLTEITRTGSSRFIAIPEGYDQKGWRLFAQFVTEGCSQGVDKLKSNVFTKSTEQIVTDRNAFAAVKVVDSGDSAPAYAEVKKDASAGRALARLEGDWRKAFVCERERISDSWAMIQAELCKLLECNLMLMPFQINKAIFFCNNVDKVHYFLGRVFLKSELKVVLEEWEAEVNSIVGQRFYFNEGWIAIEGLRFHLWRWEVFSRIADNFGGLIEVDRQTLFLDNLFNAKIKVKGLKECFLSNFLDIQIGNKKYMVCVWPLRHLSNNSFKPIFNRNWWSKDFYGQNNSWKRKNAGLEWRLKKDGRADAQCTSGEVEDEGNRAFRPRGNELCEEFRVTRDARSRLIKAAVGVQKSYKEALNAASNVHMGDVSEVAVLETEAVGAVKVSGRNKVGLGGSSGPIDCKDCLRSRFGPLLAKSFSDGPVIKHRMLGQDCGDKKWVPLEPKRWARKGKGLLSASLLDVRSLSQEMFWYSGVGVGGSDVSDEVLHGKQAILVRGKSFSASVGEQKKMEEVLKAILKEEGFSSGGESVEAESLGEFGFVEDSLDGYRSSEDGEGGSEGSKSAISESEFEKESPARDGQVFLDGIGQLFANEVGYPSNSSPKVRSLETVHVNNAINFGGGGIWQIPWGMKGESWGFPKRLFR